MLLGFRVFLFCVLTCHELLAPVDFVVSPSTLTLFRSKVTGGAVARCSVSARQKLVQRWSELLSKLKRQNMVVRFSPGISCGCVISTPGAFENGNKMRVSEWQPLQ